MRSCTVFSGPVRPRAPVLAAALLLTLVGCQEDAGSPTAPEPTPALSTSSATALSFRQVSAGGVHTCALTMDDRAYCWGYNFYGQVGDGTIADRSAPVAVAGGLRFRQISAGQYHSCGVTTDDRAYCWGNSQNGQVGDGSTSADGFRRLTPVAVTGGHRFRQISAGQYHTCAINRSSDAYCWGFNFYGQLGDGTRTDRPAPAAVVDGLLFRQVSAGGYPGQHTCGVTTGNRAYCWGQNLEGQLGDGTSAMRVRPVAVLGGRSFRQVAAGRVHTCGVTTGDQAFCWGRNNSGQLGDGTETRRRAPVAVVGRHQFRGIVTGAEHTCGVTTGSVAYCWGYNGHGQLGDGSIASRRVRPVAVSGGLRFNAVIARVAGRHTCGVTTDDRTYCWGDNFHGQLGDGTTTNRRTPVAVVGPM